MTPPRALVILSALIAPIAFSFTPAHALSCTRLQDTYVLACDGRDCAPRFRAPEIPAYFACARRVILTEFPSSALARIQRVVLAQYGQPPNGVVEVVLRRAYLPLKYDVVEEWEARYEKDPYYILRMRIITEGEEAFRAALEKRSVEEAREERLAKIKDNVEGLLVAVAFVAWCVWFGLRIRRKPKTAHLGLPVRALFFNVLFFGVASSIPFIAGARVPLWQSLAALLPIVAVLIQLAIFAVAHFRGRDLPDAALSI